VRFQLVGLVVQGFPVRLPVHLLLAPVVGAEVDKPQEDPHLTV
jgi:hypothetical protein